jgi:hypothetical protein
MRINKEKNTYLNDFFMKPIEWFASKAVLKID